MKSTSELTFHLCELRSWCLICSTLQLHYNAIAGSALELQRAGVSETLERLASLLPFHPSLPRSIRSSVNLLGEKNRK